MILVTGANGFVGSAIMTRLRNNAVTVRGAVRQRPCDDMVAVGNIGPNTNWFPALQGIEVVIHTAARVHVMDESSDDPLAAFCSVNLEGTERLTRQAAIAGVRRLIYLSSIKVNGESTDGRSPFSEFDSPEPEDPYAISKWRAEEVLRRVSEETGIEVVIIRPPLIYGPGVRANFLSMMRWLAKGVPLPLGSLHNRRSLVALDNLVDFVLTCSEHPAAANQTFMVADGEDLTTTELLLRTGNAIGKPPRLFSMPVWLLRAGAGMVGKGAIIERLCGSLQVDITKANEMLGWTPSVTVNEALKETAQHFLSLY